MVTTGGVWDTPITDVEIDPFAKILYDRKIVNKLRKRTIFRQQLSDGTQTAIAELATITITGIGKTELTLVGAASVNSNDYDGHKIDITYKSSNGETHGAQMYFNTTNSTTEVAFTKTGAESGAVTDFYCLLTMSATYDPDGGHTFGIGSTGALTMGVIQAGATAAVAADISGVGPVYVRGVDNSASMQSKAHVLKYFTPWGELKTATASTAADSTTEVRFIIGTVWVADFYRVSEFVTETVPAGTKYLILTDAACGNVDGSGGDVYGCIEEGILQSIHSNFWVPATRRAWLGLIHIQFPQLGTSEVAMQIHCTPLGAAQPMIIPFNAIGHMHYPLGMEIEPDTEISFTMADIANAGTGDFHLTIYYGQKKTSTNVLEGTD